MPLLHPRTGHLLLMIPSYELWIITAIVYICLCAVILWKTVNHYNLQDFHPLPFKNNSCFLVAVLSLLRIHAIQQQILVFTLVFLSLPLVYT